MKKLLITILCLLAAGALFAQEDWANFKRYSTDNASVTTTPLAVLMGDSITDGWPWNDPEFFAEHNFIGRGISGQCTAQMLVRFRRDVIDLHPKYVIILAGINDIARNQGAMSEIDDIFGNIVSMCEIAVANKIRPVLCTLTPANKLPWRPEITDTREKVDRLNSLIRDYAGRHKILLVDYNAALADSDGGFPAEFSKDGIHPTKEGYSAMEKVLLKVLH